MLIGNPALNVHTVTLNDNCGGLLADRLVAVSGKIESSSSRLSCDMLDSHLMCVTITANTLLTKLTAPLLKRQIPHLTESDDVSKTLSAAGRSGGGAALPDMRGSFSEPCQGVFNPNHSGRKVLVGNHLSRVDEYYI